MARSRPTARGRAAAGPAGGEGGGVAGPVCPHGARAPVAPGRPPSPGHGYVGRSVNAGKRLVGGA